MTVPERASSAPIGLVEHPFYQSLRPMDVAPLHEMTAAFTRFFPVIALLDPEARTARAFGPLSKGGP